MATHVPERARIVDLGCGCGTLSRLLAATLPGVTVTGIERDPLLVALASAATADRDDERVAFVAGDVLVDQIAELAGGPDDAVVSSAFLHYFTGAELATLHANVHRSLTPGGLAIAADRFADAAPDGRGDRGAEWTRWWDAIRDDPDLAPLATTAPRSDPPPLTAAAHVGLMRQAGFEGVELISRPGGDQLLWGVAAAGSSRCAPPADAANGFSR